MSSAKNTLSKIYIYSYYTLIDTSIPFTNPNVTTNRRYIFKISLFIIQCRNGKIIFHRSIKQLLFKLKSLLVKK